MQVNSVSLSNISGYQNHKQHAQSNVSPNIAFEGKGDVFEKTKFVQNFKNKIKQVLNCLRPKKELKVREYEPNTDKIAKSVKPQQSSSFALKPATEIDGSDFSKLEGEFDKYGDKVIKDDNGNVVRKFWPSGDGKTLDWINDYEPKTGKKIKQSSFREDGKTLDFIYDYDPKTDKQIKGSFFRKDGKTLSWVNDYDPNTGNKIKQTCFREDGKTLAWVADYDPDTGNKIKQTCFRKDGKTLSWVADYDPNTGNKIKLISFREDGKKVLFVTEYDPKIANKEIRRIYYKEDGTVDKIVPAE